MGEDFDTGIYRHAANWLGFTAGGTVRAVITPQGILSTQSGSATSPAFSFSIDADLGIYRSGTNSLTITTAGSNIATFSANQVNLIAGSASTPALTSEYQTTFLVGQPKAKKISDSRILQVAPLPLLQCGTA
jgi:hypothetical protein